MILAGRRYLSIPLAANLLLVATSFAPIAFRPTRKAPSLGSSSPSDEDFARAFAQFEELESLDDDDGGAAFELDGTEMERVMKAIAVDDPSPEDEFKLYGDMYQELDADDDIFQDVMKQMGSDLLSDEDVITATDGEMLQATPTIPIGDDLLVVADTDDFLQQAWEQAMSEIQPGEMTGEFKESILQDTDLMKEIEAIFDRGNDQLLANLEEIRQEQTLLARASAERSIQRAESAMAVDQARMDAARNSVSRIMDRVKNEEEQVQLALTELQKAQAEMNQDPLMKFSDLKAGGTVKQGALVGALLFGLRAVTESLAMMDGESHAAAALVQGALAVACAAYFVLF